MTASLRRPVSCIFVSRDDFVTAVHAELSSIRALVATDEASYGAVFKRAARVEAMLAHAVRTGLAGDVAARAVHEALDCALAGSSTF